MRQSELIDIYILEILEQRANKDHRLFQKDIMRYLDEDYNLVVGRNTLAKYVDELKKKGYIAGKRGYYKAQKFSDEELRLLIDGVLFGQHIPAGDAKELIKKLKSMSELGLKNRINNVHYVEGFNRTQNKSLYQMIDTIDEAIQKEKKLRISPMYFNYEKQRPAPIGREWLVDPYKLVTEKSHYYLIGCVDDGRDSSHHGDILENLRIDRWDTVEITKEPRRKIETIPGYENGFRLDEYMLEHIYMWSGESDRVTLRIKTYNMSDFIDWFGTDYQMIKSDRYFTEVRIKVNVNAIVKWALQYGKVATVLKPERVRNMVIKELDDIKKKYEENS